MTKKIKFQAEIELDEDGVDDFAEYIEDLKEFIHDYKELKELQDDRLQRNDKPVEGSTTPKKK